MTVEPEVVALPFGLSAVYVLRSKAKPPQPAEPTPELLEQAPWLLTTPEDACPF